MEPIYRIAGGIISIINDIFVPLVFALSFALFILGVFKYFFQGATNPAEVKKGRDFVIYGVVGFFLMISIWGIVRLLTGTFGFENANRPCIPTFSNNRQCPPAGTQGTPGYTNQPQNLFEGTTMDDTQRLPQSDLERDPVIY